MSLVLDKTLMNKKGGVVCYPLFSFAYPAKSLYNCVLTTQKPEYKCKKSMYCSNVHFQYNSLTMSPHLRFTGGIESRCE